MSDSIKKLQDLFSKFPTVGSRTAGRFVFYLVNLSKPETDQLISAIQDVKNNIALCKLCFQPFEKSLQSDICAICSDANRNKQILCIVEKETDLISVENTKRYKGLYFILGGTLTLRKTDGSNLRIDPLKERVKNSNFSEIIIALNPTPEGKSTSILVERALKESFDAAQDKSQKLEFKITHLAKGLPVGGELEYADDETLASAFDGRK